MTCTVLEADPNSARKVVRPQINAALPRMLAAPALFPQRFPLRHPSLRDDAFTSQAHELVDWIAQYLRDLERLPVRAQTRPGSIAAALAPHAPADPEPLDHILHDARETLLPGITHWQHPGFMAYFATTASTPGMLGEILGAALNVNGMLWATSPAATELEQVTMRWLAEMLGVPATWFGQLTDTASTSTLLALAAAREADVTLDVREAGLAGRDLPSLRVYCSEFAHSSVDKAVMVLGLGHRNLVKIPVDDRFQMRADVLEAQIAQDRNTGARPLAIVATVGTTSVASVDPLAAIAQIAEREHVWLHVDAAYAGAVAIAPEYRWVFDGLEGADSLVVNPHKWLLTPVGCSALWVKREDALRNAFTLVPEYLRTNAANAGEVFDYHDVGYQLGRPFRALKLWMVLRAYGVNGLIAVLREHCAIAQRFADSVRTTKDWTIAAPVRFSLACVRYEPPGCSPDQADDINMQILETVNARGRVFLSHTRLQGRVVLRIAIGNARTEERHVGLAWQELQDAAAQRVRSPRNGVEHPTIAARGSIA
jgi:aromatic-L-amino-acid decarboxylase